MESQNINLNEEEIAKTLNALRSKWRICAFITNIGMPLLFLVTVLVVPGSLLTKEPEDIVLTVIYALAAAMILFLILLAILFLRQRQWNTYVNTYKNLIPRKVIEATMENGKCNFYRGYTREELIALNILTVSRREEFSSDDMISGIYKGIKYKRSDVHFSFAENQGRSSKNVGVIDGRILEFTFPKQITGKLTIVKKNDPYTLSDDEKVEMEDVDFNQGFNVYANDPHSAFYLLTPQFMEHIKELHDKDEHIYIRFNREKVYFLQSGHGGIFEPPKDKIDVRSEVQKCEAELKEIWEIIEILQKDIREAT